MSGPLSGKRRGGKIPLSKIDVARRIERVIFIGLSKAPQAAWLVTTSKAQVSSSDHGKQRRALSMKVEAHKAFPKMDREGQQFSGPTMHLTWPWSQFSSLGGCCGSVPDSFSMFINQQSLLGV